MEHKNCLLDKHAYTHAHACTRPRTGELPLTHASQHTHTQMCNTYCFSRQLLRERASVSRYTYIACLFPFYKAEQKAITNVLSKSYPEAEFSFRSKHLPAFCKNQDPFAYCPPIYTKVFQAVPCLKVSPPKLCIHVSTPLKLSHSPCGPNHDSC
jgi:hypothetical protein